MVDKSEIRTLVAQGSSASLTDDKIDDLISIAKRQIRLELEDFELVFDEQEYPARGAALFWYTCILGLIHTGQIEDVGFAVSEVEMRADGQNPKFDWFREQFLNALGKIEPGIARFGILNEMRDNRDYGGDA